MEEDKDVSEKRSRNKTDDENMSVNSMMNIKEQRNV